MTSLVNSNPEGSLTFSGRTLKQRSELCERIALKVSSDSAMETFSVDMDDLLICDGSQIILASSSGSSEMSPGEAAEAVATVKPASSGQTTSTGTTRRPRKTSSSSDVVTRLVRSRQSAKECRARKKLRYTYLNDLIAEREKANLRLRQELLQLAAWGHDLDEGRVPQGLINMLQEEQEQKASA